MEENERFVRKGDFYYRRVEPIIKVLVVIIALSAVTLVLLDKLGKI